MSPALLLLILLITISIVATSDRRQSGDKYLFGNETFYTSEWYPNYKLRIPKDWILTSDEGECPNRHYIRKHSKPANMPGSQNAITFTNMARRQTVPFNHVIDNTTDYRRTSSHNCRNYERKPLYLVKTNMRTGVQTVTTIGLECAVSHHPVNGHILWWTWSCRDRL